MQLAVNAQVPKELGGLGAQVLYIGRCALVVGRCVRCSVLDLVVHTAACRQPAHAAGSCGMWWA
jgi:hypothetical protein